MKQKIAVDIYSKEFEDYKNQTDMENDFLCRMISEAQNHNQLPQVLQSYTQHIRQGAKKCMAVLNALDACGIKPVKTS